MGELTSRLRNFASGLYRDFTNCLHSSTLFVPTAGRRTFAEGEMTFLRRRAPDVVATLEAPRMTIPSFAAAVRTAAYNEEIRCEDDDAGGRGIRMNMVSMGADEYISRERGVGIHEGRMWRELGRKREESKYLFTIGFRLDEPAERSLPTMASMARG